MSGSVIPSDEDKGRAAGIFTRLLHRSVGSRGGLPGRLREQHYDPDKIEKHRSGSILELSVAGWPRRFRLSIHSDDGGCLLGYGILDPIRGRGQSADQGIREHLAACVSDADGDTAVHWAWHRYVDEPMRDFSRQETLSEVEKIRRGEKSKGDAAFRQASNDLARLAEALDGWYSSAGRS